MILKKTRDLKHNVNLAFLRDTGNVDVAVAVPVVVPESKEIAVVDPQDRRKRPVKGSQGRKRAAYLDWA